MKTGRQAGRYWPGTPARPGPGRKETAVFGTLMTAFLGGSPFVAYAAGRWVCERLSRKAEAERASLRQVPATLLQAAPRRAHGADAARGTPAQWRAPDGQLRTGQVSAPAGAAAGSTVRVWVTEAGDLTARPTPERQIANRTELAQGVAAALFAVGLGTVGRRAHRQLGQRQIAG